jgi:hypothetical protein
MPGALGDVLQAIQDGFGQIPPSVLVVGLLFGPTLAWIGFRLYAAPRSARIEAERDDLFWICGECRSANEPGRQRCYLCQTHRDALPGALRIVDRDQIIEIDDAPDGTDSPGVPVGPGRAPLPSVASDESGELAPLTVVPFERLGKRPGRAPVAVPIQPEVDADDGAEAADDDDVVAASHQVTAVTPQRRAKRSTKRDAAG